jgi:hypothetical protein
MTPGSIVRFRNRDWVLVPSDVGEPLLWLRPLAGTTEDIVAVDRRLCDLLGYTMWRRI